MSDYLDGYRQGLADHKTGARLDSQEKLAEWLNANSQDWKRGWGDGYGYEQETTAPSARTAATTSPGGLSYGEGVFLDFYEAVAESLSGGEVDDVVARFQQTYENIKTRED